MSVLYISEYAEMPDQQGNPMQIGNEPALAVQHITFTGTAGVSAFFNAKTRFVWLHVDGIASYKFSTDGTAATANSDPRMVAGQTEFFGVDQSAGLLKVSAVTST